MNLVVEIGGRTRQVEVERVGQGWVATLDGRAVHVDVARVGDFRSLLIAALEGGPNNARRDGRAGATAGRPEASYDVVIDDRGRGELVVHVRGVAIPVVIRDPRGARHGRGSDAATAGAGHRDVRAPMPGRIVKVLVRPGETVSARQGLVVVEAMKMENELRAPKDGRITDVRVTEGMSVEANAILITIE